MVTRRIPRLPKITGGRTGEEKCWVGEQGHLEAIEILLCGSTPIAWRRVTEICIPVVKKREVLRFATSELELLESQVMHKRHAFLHKFIQGVGPGQDLIEAMEVAAALRTENLSRLRPPRAAWPWSHRSVR